MYYSYCCLISSINRSNFVLLEHARGFRDIVKVVLDGVEKSGASDLVADSK